MLALLLMPAAGRVPAQVAVPGGPPSGSTDRQPPAHARQWPNFGALLSQGRATPHQAVARIMVPEDPVTAYGTGTLIDVRDRYGLVITNWHVVRDATGTIEVTFPNGFRSPARALKVDPDWDLAALVTWRPPIEPVCLANRAPAPGDLLTIHGYGQGDYRIASGRCTQYYAPRADFPQEMVELDVEARQGDSGGPIFNDRGELAGVLFGAGQGTTIGSFNGRVDSFLATLAPNIGRHAEDNLIASTVPPVASARNSRPCESRCANNETCISSSWPEASESGARWSSSGAPERSEVDSRSCWPSSPWSGSTVDARLANSSQPNSHASARSPASAENQTAVVTQQAAAASLLDHAKSVLAIVGLLTVCVHIVRAVS